MKETENPSGIRVKVVIVIFFSVIGGISNVVTIFSESDIVKELAQTVSKAAFLIAGVFIFFAVYEYVKTEIKQYKQMISDLNELKTNLGNSELLNDIRTLTTAIQSMENQARCFNDTCGLTRMKVEDSNNKIIGRLDARSDFRYNTADVTQELIGMLDQNHAITEVCIICYGRSAYGAVVNHINEKRLKTRVKIIVCNPEKNQFICRANDDTRIRNHIKEMLENPNIEVYVSDIPPAIRASTVYINGTPIWSATQSYQFTLSQNGHLELSRPKESLIATCSEKSSKRDFDGIIRCFETEFKTFKRM